MLKKPRKAWIAGVLTLFTIGLGHIYAGHWKKGIFLYFVPQFLLVVLLVAVIAFTATAAGLMVSVVLLIGFCCYCILDAAKACRKAGDSYVIKRYNRWYTYLLCWACSGLILQPLMGTLIKSNFVQAYKIPSGAMMPALQVGDQIFTRKGLLAENNIERGDIVVFPFPGDPSKDFIKRVVGLGGERLEIKNKQVYIDGEPLVEPYKINTDSKIIPPGTMPRDNKGLIHIPDDALFVMGDNRDNSYDSRFWGVVKKSAVKGKATSIYWSWDREHHHIRWDRIGNRIE